MVPSLLPAFVVLNVPVGADSNAFLTILKEALRECQPPHSWSIDEWVDGIEQEYGMQKDSKEEKIKFHLRYLAYYLTNVDYDKPVRTILVEKQYLSMTFLTDYKNFYSNIISQYERLCSRLHFFSCAITGEEFNQFLSNTAPAQQNLNNDYIGCMAVRPLHKHIVGTTLLRHYPTRDADGQAIRHFPAIRTYELDLFGIPLKIDTLAFTSQDKAVGACASFALWMAFHKTHKLFKTKLPTPSEITRQAGRSSTIRYRPFPSRGLDGRQIGNVIEGTSLEVQYRSFGVDKAEKVHYKLWLQTHPATLLSEDPNKGKPSDDSQRIKAHQVLDVDLAKAHIYAYSRLGIPVLLGLEFENGEHLIVMSGYRELSQPEPEREIFKAMLGERLLLKSRRIDRLYCHDDNIGAFSRLFFCESADDLENRYYGTVRTSWPSDAETENNFNVRDKVHTQSMRKRATLKDICIPIEEGIRMDFEDIYIKVSYVDNLFDEIQKLLSQAATDYRIQLLNDLRKQEWDIYLTTAKEYKEEVLQSAEAIHVAPRKTTIVSEVLPRYVWVARGRLYQNSEWRLMTELVFDSTESPSSFPCKIFTFETDIFQALSLAITLIARKSGENFVSLKEDLDRILNRKHLLRLMPPAMMVRQFSEPMKAVLTTLKNQSRLDE